MTMHGLHGRTTCVRRRRRRHTQSSAHRPWLRLLKKWLRAENPNSPRLSVSRQRWQLTLGAKLQSPACGPSRIHLVASAAGFGGIFRYKCPHCTLTVGHELLARTTRGKTLDVASTLSLTDTASILMVSQLLEPHTHTRRHASKSFHRRPTISIHTTFLVTIARATSAVNTNWVCDRCSRSRHNRRTCLDIWSKEVSNRPRRVPGQTVNPGGLYKLPQAWCTNLARKDQIKACQAECVAKGA